MFRAEEPGERDGEHAADVRARDRDVVETRCLRGALAEGAAAEHHREHQRVGEEAEHER